MSCLEADNPMTQNRRIILNICATYGRSLYALVLGLMSARWTLAILGQVDYGLMGVVGGLTAFIAFFNGLLAGAIGRFYAVNVGLAMKSGSESEGLEECRKWFNTAIVIHSFVPLILILVGYPFGVWAIEKWMTIPPDRVHACIWVFRFVCVSCLVGMVNVPFSAMYGAKQYIAELTVYSVISTTINFFFLWYMLSHPGEWLAKYACFTMLVTVVPQLVICYRAIRVFPECKLRPAYFFDRSRFKELSIYAFWQFFGNAGGLVRSQGITLLVNKCFGPIMNGSMAIANSVAGHTDTLSASLTGAFSPVVMNLEGKGERDKMLSMACRSSKFGSLLCLVFLLPLTLEVRSILLLWLENPPPLTADACMFTFAIILMDQFSRGLNISVCASGKIGMFSAMIGSMHVMSLPVAILIVVIGGGGFLSVLGVLVVFKAVGIGWGAMIAKKTMGFPIAFWIRDVVIPVSCTVVLCLFVGHFVKWLLGAFLFLRMGIAFGCMELLLALLSWRFVLNKEENEYFWNQIDRKVISKFRRKRR